MDTTPPVHGWERLAHFIEEAINELGLTQAQVQERGGPSPTKIRDIIAGRSVVLSSRKRRGLEKALEWAPGSVERILAGGTAEAEHQPTISPQNLADMRAHLESIRLFLEEIEAGESPTHYPLAVLTKKGGPMTTGKLASLTPRHDAPPL